MEILEIKSIFVQQILLDIKKKTEYNLVFERICMIKYFICQMAVSSNDGEIIKTLRHKKLVLALSEAPQ